MLTHLQPAFFLGSYLDDLKLADILYANYRIMADYRQKVRKNDGISGGTNFVL
jgi:hypothetical protein